VEARFSAPVQTGPGTHLASYTMCAVQLLGVKWPECGPNHPSLSGNEVKERVELHFYYPFAPSFKGWSLPYRNVLPNFSFDILKASLVFDLRFEQSVNLMVAVVQRSTQLLLATLLRSACVLTSWLISTAFSDDRSLILPAAPLVPSQCRDSPFSMFDLSWVMPSVSPQYKASLIRYIKHFILWTLLCWFIVGI